MNGRSRSLGKIASLSLFNGIAIISINGQSEVVTGIVDCSRCLALYDSVIDAKKQDFITDEDAIDAALVQCVLSREGLAVVTDIAGHAEREWDFAHKACFSEIRSNPEVYSVGQKELLEDYAEAVNAAISSLIEEFPDIATDKKVRDMMQSYFDDPHYDEVGPHTEYSV